ncbi:MAG: cation diffusion facilitator family transporter [Bacteroidetes bacterium]|nr:cation diffusion facilitator family transporter [Bacteroidota bacterium]
MIPTKGHAIKKASWISIFGNAILSILKIVIGFISGSLAVVADGIDSASDIITSIIILVTSKIISKPPNVRFAYGYEKADTIASKILSFIIFFAGAQLAISTGTKIIENELREMPNPIALYVTVVSIIGKLLLALYQFKVGKRVNSSMLIANAKNMQNDVIISISVLIGLVFTFIFKMPILDIITAFAVSGWIMWVAIKIFIQSNTELMDGILDTSVYKLVFAAALEVDGVYNPHRVRIRQINNAYMISIDIEVDGSFTVSESHNISHEVGENIKKKIENVYDIVVHIEPLGTIDKGEKYGVSNKDFQK